MFELLGIIRIPPSSKFVCLSRYCIDDICNFVNLLFLVFLEQFIFYYVHTHTHYFLSKNHVAYESMTYRDQCGAKILYLGDKFSAVFYP